MTRTGRTPTPRLRAAAAAVCLVALLLGGLPAAAHAAQTPTPAPAGEGEGSPRIREVIPRVVRLHQGEERYTRSDRDDSVQVALFADVLFAFDSAELSPDAGRDLDEVAALIRDQATTGVISVHGYTDSVGDQTYNLELSEQRAAAVRDALAARLAGRPTEFEVRGLGEAEPVAPNTTPDGGDNPDGRRLNRRVTVSFDR